MTIKMSYDYMAILKLDRGFVKQLLKSKVLSEDDYKGINGEELELALKEKEVIIEFHKEKHKRILEISDVNGTFAMGIELNEDKFNKLKRIVKGP